MHSFDEAKRQDQGGAIPAWSHASDPTGELSNGIVCDFHRHLSGAQFSMVAILATLEHRDVTGDGQWTDLSMQDTTAWPTQWAWNGAGPADGLSLAACSDYFAVVKGPQVEEAALASGAPRSRGPNWSRRWSRLAGHAGADRLRDDGAAAAEDAGGAGCDAPLVCRPMPPLGRDTAELLGSKVR